MNNTLTDTRKIEAGESKAKFKEKLVIWLMNSMNSNFLKPFLTVNWSKHRPKNEA